jgi:transposase
MLKPSYEPHLTPVDEAFFTQLVPENHYLRRLKAVIDFTPCRALVADCYSATHGRGALDPVLLIKLLILRFHYGLSDERVIEQAQVNLAFRFFLDLSWDDALPEPSLLSQFRTRLGDQKIEAIFQEILRQAHAAGLVKDRLRLKDATHLIADIAVPATLGLVAEIRDRLLAAAESFAPDEVAAQRQTALAIRQASADLPDAGRLLRRVEHLRALVTWAAEWQARLECGAPPVSEAIYDAFVERLAQARKILQDREPPKAPDQLRALSDPDARRGKHGEFYDGYLADVLMDADSELITAIEVLPANADEAANAQALLASEEAAHGVDIENLSMDAIGFNGPVLQALSDDPAGPQVTVWTPPKEAPPPYPELFQPRDFTLNEAGDEVTCPNGEKTRTRYADKKGHGEHYQFSTKQCRDCPLRAQCQPPGNRQGRRVRMNFYTAQYAAAKQRATTDEYKQIRKQHPAIERKLNELVRWHDGRRVRFRGRLRVRAQYFLLAVVVNCKRIVRLLAPAPTAQPA